MGGTIDARTLSVPYRIVAEVHEIEGGGYWAEVPRLTWLHCPGRNAGALEENLVQAVEDWLSGLPVKTKERRESWPGSRVASRFPTDLSLSPTPTSRPPSWDDEDE